MVHLRDGEGRRGVGRAEPVRDREDVVLLRRPRLGRARVGHGRAEEALLALHVGRRQLRDNGRLDAVARRADADERAARHGVDRREKSGAGLIGHGRDGGEQAGDRRGRRREDERRDEGQREHAREEALRPRDGHGRPEVGEAAPVGGRRERRRRRRRHDAEQRALVLLLRKLLLLDDDRLGDAQPRQHGERRERKARGADPLLARVEQRRRVLLAERLHHPQLDVGRVVDRRLEALEDERGDAGDVLRERHRRDEGAAELELPRVVGFCLARCVGGEGVVVLGEAHADRMLELLARGDLVGDDRGGAQIKPGRFLDEVCWI